MIYLLYPLIVAVIISLITSAIAIGLVVILLKKIDYVGKSKIISATLISAIGSVIISFFFYIIPVTSDIQGMYKTAAQEQRPMCFDCGTSINVGLTPLLNMILPFILLSILNFLIAKFLLKFSSRDCLIFAIAIGFLTCPWLLYFHYSTITNYSTWNGFALPSIYSPNFILKFFQPASSSIF